MYRSDSHGRLNTIYIVGSKGAGKTSLLNIILGKGYNENIKRSKIGIKTSFYKYNDKELIIKELTDDDDFSNTNILKNQLEEIILILVVFAIDDEDSLEYAKSLILFIKSNITYNLGMQIILFGNKYDSKKNDPKIKVNQIEAENFTSDIDNCSFYELSCKTGYNTDIIEKLIKEVNDNNMSNSKLLDKDDFNNEEISRNNNKASQSCIIF